MGSPLQFPWWDTLRIDRASSRKPTYRGADVIDFTRQLLFLAWAWGRPLLTASQDVKTAFDGMQRTFIAELMSDRGASHG